LPWGEDWEEELGLDAARADCQMESTALYFPLGQLARGWAATPSWVIVYIIGVWRGNDANMRCKSKKLKPAAGGAARGAAARGGAGGGGGT